MPVDVGARGVKGTGDVGAGITIALTLLSTSPICMCCSVGEADREFAKRKDCSSGTAAKVCDLEKDDFFLFCPFFFFAVKLSVTLSLLLLLRLLHNTCECGSKYIYIVCVRMCLVMCGTYKLHNISIASSS